MRPTAKLDAVKSVSWNRNEQSVYSEIEWEDFNYPKFLKIVHYDIEDIEDDYLRLILQRMHVIVILIAVICIVNIVDCIILVASKIYPWLTIMYTVFNLMIFFSLAFYTFYMGYRGLALKSYKIKLVYKILQLANCCLWVIFSVIDAGAFNGFVRVARLKTINGASAVFCIILGIIESVSYLTACGLGLYCVWIVHTVSRVVINIYNSTSKSKVQMV